ncbi:MAG: LamG domain-containing protein [Cyclobacteriaceae bacterium]|nr:LamG domain-containing protein [Cyclobacteriaceae bacterium SS2]
MKAILIPIIIMLSNFAVAQSQAPTNGLVAYYPFNGNGNDASGNGNHLTLTSDNYVNDRHGNNNSALTVLSGFLGTGPQMLDGSDKITIAFWFYTPSTNPGNRYPIYFSGNGWAVSTRMSTDTDQRIRFENGGVNHSPSSENIGNGLNRWVFACVSYDNLTNEVIFYFDNLSSKVQSKEFGQLSATVDASIAQYFTSGTIGKALDDIRIYDRVLNEQEIVLLYNDGGPLPQSSNTWQPNGDNLFYDGFGNIGIGTNEPAAKLTVSGPILSTEVKVKTDVSTYPDFVFKSDYSLPSLVEIENFIRENGHLPEIPTAADAEDGIYLGEMNIKLLQKIEELTLYLIEQNKRIEELERMVQQNDEQSN